LIRSSRESDRGTVQRIEANFGFYTMMEE